LGLLSKWGFPEHGSATISSRNGSRFELAMRKGHYTCAFGILEEIMKTLNWDKHFFPRIPSHIVAARHPCLP
jgi:hypothetical protein